MSVIARTFVLCCVLSALLPAQSPCLANPLSMPLQAGDTSTSSIIGGGVSDPFFPPSGCNFYGDNLSPEDWYEWTAPSSGLMTITTCPGEIPGASAFFDSSLAVWEGTSCGAGLTFFDCNGDGPSTNCPGFESTISFPVTSGLTYALGSSLSSGTPPVVLSLSGGSGLFNLDLLAGTPFAQYYTVASFDALNLSFPGTGWWGGMHITVQDAFAQIALPFPPFRGNLDSVGDAPFSLFYPPTLTGTSIWVVTFTFDSLGNWIGQSSVESFVF